MNECLEQYKNIPIILLTRGYLEKQLNIEEQPVFTLTSPCPPIAEQSPVRSDDEVLLAETDPTR